MSEYKLQVEYLPPLASYTFANDKTVVFQKMKELPAVLQTQSVKTEFDLSQAWAKFAEQALDGEYAESETKCWYGHYEQFGRVMLELMRMSRDKDLEEFEALAKMMPNLDEFTFIAEPTGTEDRKFYRLWFALIGHPDFQSPRFARIEYLNSNYWDYLMGEAVDKVNEQLHKLSK